MSQDAMIVEQMRQLNVLITHIKNTQTQLKKMKEAKSQLEERIMKYLNQTNRSGAKTNDLLILTKEKTVRNRKKKDEKEHDVLNVLQQAGVKDAENTYNQILSALKGDEHKSTTLVVKDPKKKK